MKIKGSVLRARLAFVEELGGSGALRRLLDGLSDEDRGALQGILTSTWYPFDLGYRLDEAIVRVLGKGSPKYFEKLGKSSAEKNLCGVHKDFLVPGDPQGFLRRTPMIYSFYYHTGRREYQATGATQGVITTHDAEAFSVADCLTVVGWYRKALEMCGATGVKVVESECRAKGAAVCRYLLSWD